MPRGPGTARGGPAGGIPAPAAHSKCCGAELLNASGRSAARRDPERRAGAERAMGGGCAGAWLLPLLLLLLLRSRASGLTERDCNQGTFFNPSTGKCKPCQRCEGVLEYEQRCSRTANAICRCIPRYRCSEKEGVCTECLCENGQQLTEQGCQPCPDGTFNDRNGGNCSSWTKCPGNTVLVKGTRTRDVRCSSAPEGTTTASTNLLDITPAVTERDGQLLTISIALTVALLLCILSLLILSIAFRAWAQRKLLAIFVKKPLGQLAQEVDDCSCRYPEEEEGGGGEGLKGELLEKYP